MKLKKLTALLSAAIIGMTACLSSGFPSAAAEDSADAQEAVSLDDIYALRSFLLGDGYAEDCQILDMDGNGALDARDLTLAKRVYLSADRLSNLRADIPNILLNEEETVTFTVSANRPGLSKTVVLYDGENKEPAAYMHDDGKDGDETANDCIYSAQLKLISDDFKNVDYYAASGACKSEPFRICFFRELTEEEVNGYLALANRFQEAETFEAAYQLAESADEITDYIIDDTQKTVSYQTIYHISGFWELPYEETDVLGTGPFAIDPDEMSWFRYAYTYAEDMLPNCLITPAHPEKKDVIVLLPYHSAPKDTLEGTDFRGTGRVLADGLNSSFTLKNDDEVSVYQLTKLADYGCVIWFGHGSFADIPADSKAYKVPVLITGEHLVYSQFKHDPEVFYNHRSYAADFASGRIACLGDRIIVAQDFFDYYYPEGSLNNSLWFLGACCSMTTNDLADTLVRKGAGGVFGMSEPSRVNYADSVVFEILLNSMLLSASTAGEAENEAVRIYGRSKPISEKKWPGGIGASILHAGDPNFRLVDNIEPVEPEDGFPDDPDFVVDNEPVYTLYTDEDGTETYRVHGKSGNVSVVIPSTYKDRPVVGFDKNGFWGLKHLRRISLPDSFTEIPDDAFTGCIELQQVSLPASIKRIGKQAFERCYKLNSIRLPLGLTSIDSHAFTQCSDLSEIMIPSTISFIGDNAFNSSGLKSFTLDCHPLEELSGTFYNCQKLESVSLISSVEKLSGTFSKCPVLSHVDLPQGVKTITDRAFYDNYEMKEICIPGSVETITEEAFSYCRALETVTLPDCVTTLGTKAFSNCISLKQAVLPDRLKEIGSSVFYSCEALTDVQLPENLETIGGMAFAYCHALEQIDFPDSVKVIQMQAFDDCTKLTITEIPPNVEEIYSNAFYRCRFAYEDSRYPYVVLPASLQKLHLLAFDSVHVSGLVVNNPNMEFLEPTSSEKAEFKVKAANMRLFGYEGSTTQAFTEDSSHPGKFFPIEQYYADVNQ